MSEQPPQRPSVARQIIDGNALISLLAVIVALALGAVLIAFADADVRASMSYLFARPGDFFGAVWTSVSDAYLAMFRGAIFDWQATGFAAKVKPLTESLVYSVPLILAGLGIAVGFRAGLFNIGAQGQLIIGAILAAYVGFAFDLPPVLHLLLAILGGALGGAIYGAIPGVLKARTGANEVIVTIMLNWIAVYFIAYMLKRPVFNPGRTGQRSPAVSPDAKYPALIPDWLVPDNPFRLHWGFVVAILATFVVWWLLERSTLGFEIRASGANPNAARTAGMSVGRITVLTMTIAGLLAGLAATAQVLGTEGSLTAGVAASYGFDAITVALLGRSKPWGTFMAGLLFGALKAGGTLMNATTSTKIDIVLVVQSIIVLLIAAPPLVRAIWRLPDPDSPRKARLQQAHQGGCGMSAPTVPVAAGTPRAEAPVVSRISYRTPIVYALTALVTGLVFAARTPADASSTFALNASGESWFTLPNISVPSLVTTVLIALLLAGATAWALVLTRSRRGVPGWLHVLVAIGFVTAFLTWTSAGKTSVIPVTTLLAGALALSVPLIFGAMSGIVCERSGIINIAIEGQLLFGAFAAAVIASKFANGYVGLVAAPIAGALVGALLAWFAVRYRVNQIIVGVVLNTLVIGLTGFLFTTLLAEDRATWNTRQPLGAVEIPLLSQIPVLGPVLFRQTVLVYLMYLLVAGLTVMLFRSRWGLRTRAVGEHPKAADTVGIKVNKRRVWNTILGGAIAGLGGAFFTVGAGLAFGREMSAGNGFIALAAMILGKWHPVGALFAALLFGFSKNVGNVLSTTGAGVPPELLLMLPYVITVFAVAGFVGRVRPPAAEGIPYTK